MDEALSKALRELERIGISPFFRFRTGTGDMVAVIDLRHAIAIKRRNDYIYITLPDGDSIQVYPEDFNNFDYNSFYQDLESKWMATKIRYG